jgi:hypothetical protein
MLIENEEQMSLSSKKISLVWENDAAKNNLEA